MSQTITHENVDSFVNLTFVEKVGEDTWKLTVSFLKKEKTFLVGFEPKDKYAAIHSLLKFFEVFGNDTPSFEQYYQIYYGENDTQEKFISLYEKDILGKYAPAIELFGEYAETLYLKATEINTPRVIQNLFGK